MAKAAVLRNHWFKLVALGIIVVITAMVIRPHRGTAAPLPVDPANPEVVLKTNMGDITLELYVHQAPVTVGNFLNYVQTGFYTGTLFHRVIDGFMIQGGGYTADMHEKKINAPIKNEAGNGLHNLTGTIAMARTRDPNSAAAQFFINVHDNDFLDHRDNSWDGYGYCVFGRVIKGMDVVEKIAKTPVHDMGEFQNVPVAPVQILGATVVRMPAGKH